MTVELIKEKAKMADLIGESFTITGKGKVLSTKEHDSLKIWTDTNTWFWFSKGQGGDVLDWYQQQHNCDFRQALEELAQRAGLELRPLSDEERQALDHERTGRRILTLAASHFHRNLIEELSTTYDTPAKQYLIKRNWFMETVEREMIGLFLSDSALGKELKAAGLNNHPMAKAVLTMPLDMIIYVHRVGGQVVYLSGRSIEGKRHYNLPEDLAGPKQPYSNHPKPGGPAANVLVEGQADAIAMGAMGVQATALCGVYGDAGREFSHVAFDIDPAGQEKALEAALGVDPMCRVVKLGTFEDGYDGKDPADYLEFTGPDNHNVDVDLDYAKPALLLLARQVGIAQGDERQALMQRVLSIYSDMDDLLATDIKPGLSQAMDVGVSQFNRLLKAHAKQAEEKESPSRYEYSAGGAKGGTVWEQVVVFESNGVGKSAYAVRNPDGKVETRGSVDVGGITYLPYPADTGIIDKHVVLFPCKPEPYGSQKELVKGVQEFIHAYLDTDPFYEKLAAYYVLFTWTYDLFENLPYLRALGDYGTGKTRFLQAIGAVCYRPMFVSGASTVSPIFRLIDMFRGTLIIDEADFANSDAEAEIIKILNVGYYSKGVVLRSEKEANSDTYMPTVSMVYGPKILATRRPFEDRATESRCLTKRMTVARPRPGIPFVLGDEFWTEAQTLRNKLLQYRLEHHKPVTIDQSLADDSVEPRLNQVTMALKSIIDDPDMREEIDTFIRAYNATLINDRQMSLPAIILQAIADLHYTKKVNVLGEDMRDFSMQGIAEEAKRILLDVDPDAKVNGTIVSKTLSDDLGLNRRGRQKETRRKTLLYDEEELLVLMKRYGIEPLQ